MNGDRRMLDKGRTNGGQADGWWNGRTVDWQYVKTKDNEQYYNKIIEPRTTARQSDGNLWTDVGYDDRQLWRLTIVATGDYNPHELHGNGGCNTAAMELATLRYDVVAMEFAAL
jgi:hypothetical protein